MFMSLELLYRNYSEGIHHLNSMDITADFHSHSNSKYVYMYFPTIWLFKWFSKYTLLIKFNGANYGGGGGLPLSRPIQKKMIFMILTDKGFLSMKVCLFLIAIL